MEFWTSRRYRGRKLLVSCSLTSLQAAENFNASRVRLRFTRVKVRRTITSRYAIRVQTDVDSKIASAATGFLPSRE